MGVNTNQIATEKDLYFRGYTAFNSGSTQAVTKQDIEEQIEKDLIARITVNNDNSAVMTSTTTTHLSTNESAGIISTNTTYTHVIQTYDTSFLSKNKYIFFYDNANSSLDAEGHGGWCFNVRNMSSSVNLQYYLGNNIELDPNFYSIIFPHYMLYRSIILKEMLSIVVI